MENPERRKLLEERRKLENKRNVTLGRIVFPARFPDHTLPLNPAVVCRRK